MQFNPFDTEAAEYAHLRPTYPDDLFAFLATLPPDRHLAWDCATGNGQAATRLTPWFEQVVATDESAAMIAEAASDPRIAYRTAEAEDSGIASASVDLVTVAAAIHWFDLDAFYDEVRRVVRPGGALAAWTYYTPVFGDRTDDIVQRLTHDVLGPYWDQRIHYVVEEFHDLPFPFPEVEAPAFRTDMRWTMNDLLGYFETWSAALAYRREHGEPASSTIVDDLAQAWGDPRSSKELHFPLYMRVGRL